MANNSPRAFNWHFHLGSVPFLPCSGKLASRTSFTLHTASQERAQCRTRLETTLLVRVGSDRFCPSFTSKGVQQINVFSATTSRACTNYVPLFFAKEQCIVGKLWDFFKFFPSLLNKKSSLCRMGHYLLIQQGPHCHVCIWRAHHRPPMKWPAHNICKAIIQGVKLGYVVWLLGSPTEIL